MQRTKIEWTDYTWNPIKGLCPVGCWYCYARRMYKRFKLDSTICPSKEYSEIISMPLFDRRRRIISRRVFVCSTIELFHSSIKETWRDWIFEVIKYNSHLTFQILTKFPENIDRPMPDNVWLGVSVTGEEPGLDTLRVFALERIKAKLKFISYEPLLDENVIHRVPFVQWIIIGKLTGYGKKHNPRRGAIHFLVESQRRCGSAIFLKNNLKEIWGEPLIQEFPVSHK